MLKDIMPKFIMENSSYFKAGTFAVNVLFGACAGSLANLLKEEETLWWISSTVSAVAFLCAGVYSVIKNTATIEETLIDSGNCDALIKSIEDYISNINDNTEIEIKKNIPKNPRPNYRWGDGINAMFVTIGVVVLSIIVYINSRVKNYYFEVGIFIATIISGISFTVSHILCAHNLAKHRDTVKAKYINTTDTLLDVAKNISIQLSKQHADFKEDLLKEIKTAALSKWEEEDGKTDEEDIMSLDGVMLESIRKFVNKFGDERNINLRQLNENREKIEHLRKQEKRLNEKIEELEQKNGNKEKTITELKKESEQLKKESNNQKEEVEEFKRKNMAKVKEAAELKEKVKELETDIGNKTKTITKLSQKNESKAKTIDAKEGEITNLRNEIQKLKSVINNKNSVSHSFLFSKVPNSQPSNIKIKRTQSCTF